MLLDARQLYEKELRSKVVSDDWAASVAAWSIPGFFSPDELGNIAKRIIARTGGQRTYKDAAALGFLYGCTGVGVELRDPMKQALEWVSSRPAFVEGAPTAIATDGTALLGIAIGSRKLGDDTVAEKLKTWVNAFSEKTLALPAVPAWQKAAHRFAARLLDPDCAIDPTGIPKDLYFGLLAHGFVPALNDDIAQKSEEAVFSLLRSEDPRKLEPVMVAIRTGAFDWISRTAKVARPEKMQIKDVVQLLSGLERCFQRWTWEEKPRKRGGAAQQWRIENEYHVQNLLWFLLAPIFSDLKDEEYLRSTGQLQPRADLCIPSLRLIIEVKYMYETTTPRQVIEEIASDSSLYLKPGGEFSSIVAVIWDEKSRVEEHATLQKGLKELPGVIDAIIVSRPGLMS